MKAEKTGDGGMCTQVWLLSCLLSAFAAIVAWKVKSCKTNLLNLLLMSGPFSEAT